MINPSLEDYATYGFSRFPDLWEGCIFSTTPALGVTGSTLYDNSKSNLVLGTTTPVWSAVNGLIGVKSGSYSDRNLVLSNLPYITICFMAQLLGNNEVLVETSTDTNVNIGAFYIAQQFDYLTSAIHGVSTPSINNIYGVPVSSFGGYGSNIRKVSIVIKTTVADLEPSMIMMIVDGIDYSSSITQILSHSSTSGLVNFPIYLGARNKTIGPLSGRVFDLCIYNRPFNVNEAIRYTQNPLERYQRRRRFWPVSRRFNPAIARNSNILIPGVATC